MKKIIVLLCCAAALLPAQERSRPKVGLVLAGGGALGFAHIGVLKVIDSLGIPVDVAAGTSFGGLMTGLYAIGYDGDSLDALVSSIPWNDMFSDKPKRSELPYAEKFYTGRYHLTLPLNGFTPEPPGGAIAGQKISLLLSRLTRDYAHISDFDSLPIPYRCVAVDLVSGNQVVMRSGPMARAMRATMSIPTVFTPVRVGDSVLVDGGLLNNYPVDAVRAMGAEIVIGVDLDGGRFVPSDDRNMFKVLERSAAIPRYQTLEEQVRHTTLFLPVPLGDFSIADFDSAKIPAIIGRGYETALVHLDTLAGLKRYLDSFGTEPRRTFPGHERVQRTITGVKIAGNEKLETDFLRQLLSFPPGTHFSAEAVEQRITDLYALGYFETITYTTRRDGEDGTVVQVNVKERPFRDLNIGLRYDDYSKLVGIAGIRSTNLFLAGARLESELEFAGLWRSWVRVSYPSRSLDMPIYPFAEFRNHALPFILDLGGANVGFEDRSLSGAVGIGSYIGKSGTLEVKFVSEFLQTVSTTITTVPPLTSTLRYFAATLDVDRLDNIFVPTEGTRISASAEWSPDFIPTDDRYLKVKADVMQVLPLGARHAVTVGGSYYRIYDGAPLAKQFFFGGPRSFMGADYSAISGTQFMVARGEYRYEITSSIFAHGIVNLMADPDILNPLATTRQRVYTGAGAGILWNTIIGLFELDLAWGERSYAAELGRRWTLHFTGGVRF